MRLYDTRTQWEKGLTPLVSAQNEWGDVCLVLLVDEGMRFHFHRYFQLGSNWEVSVDHQRVPRTTESIVAAICWFLKQSKCQYTAHIDLYDF